MHYEEARMIARLRGFMLELDVFSHEFLTSNTHRQARLEPIQPPDYNTLDMVLRSNLTDEERRVLFPNKFDLGNPDDLNIEDCTPEAAIELLSRSEGMTPVLEGITKLTKQPGDIYRASDRVKFYRVAGLFGRFLRKNPQLFAMLEAPGEFDRGSLELTNPYPMGHEGDQRWTVGELRSLFAAQIPLSRLAEIDKAFRDPRSIIDEFEMSLQEALKRNVSSVDEAADRYETVIADWLKPMPSLQRKLLPLDQQLYVHLLVLDFINYVKVEQELRGQRLHHVPVREVSQDLRNIRPIKREDLSHPSTLSIFRPLLQRAADIEVSDKVFRSMVSNVPTLLGHYFLKLPGKLPATLEPSLIFAALVLDWDMRTNTQHFYPRMHAQTSTSGSIKMALRKFDAGNSEEYRRIFRHALDWVRYSLMGQQRLYDAQRRLTLGLIERVAGVMETHDTELVINFLNNLKEYADHVDSVIDRVKQQRNHRP